MYEVMMYVGAAGVVFFFLLSVVLFIKNNIPSAIKYFINLRHKGVDIWSANKKLPEQPLYKPERTELLDDENNIIISEPTEYLDTSDANDTIISEPTEYLDTSDAT